MYTHIHRYIHTKGKCTHIYIDTYIQKVNVVKINFKFTWHIHTYIYTHIHTYIQIGAWVSKSIQIRSFALPAPGWRVYGCKTNMRH